MREILKGIYSVTLFNTEDKQGVKDINVYIVKGNDRSLMIDTGFNRENCPETFESALEELDIEPGNLDIFITHRHFDHCSLAGFLSGKGATVYMNSEEERHSYDCLTYKPGIHTLEEQDAVLKRNGINLEPDSLKGFRKFNRILSSGGNRFLAIDPFPYRDVKAGDIFSYGEYVFSAFPLKGHTYGQMGLIDRNKKILFCADQVIEGVSPIVATTFSGENLLNGFFMSLKDIKENYSDFTLIPAHGVIIGNPSETIDRIMESYDRKIEKTREILREKKKPLTVLETARALYNYYSFPENPGDFFIFKMVITKTASILEYLFSTEEIGKETKEGTEYYSYSLMP